MSVSKLLSRIVHPSTETKDNTPDKDVARDLHDHTFGLTSDPITHFASVVSTAVANEHLALLCIFTNRWSDLFVAFFQLSALIHDVGE
jgi:hypothetical protein